MGGIVEHIIIIANRSDSSNNQCRALDSTEVGESVFVRRSGSVTGYGKVHVGFEDAE